MIRTMDSSSEFALEDEDNSRISGDEFELLDFADFNTFEQFVEDEDACSDFFIDCEDPDEIDSKCIPEELKWNQRTGFSQELQSQVTQVLCCCYLLFTHKLR